MPKIGSTALFTGSRRLQLRLVWPVLLLAVVSLSALGACGGDDDDDDDSGVARVGDIVITDVWSRPTQMIDAMGDMDNMDATEEEDEGMDMEMGGTNAAVYMTIENQGDTDDVLIAGSTEIADAVELHAVTMNEGVMQMRPLDGGIEIPAGESETVLLEPDGLHMMLIGLNQSTEVGDSFEVELEFENAGSITVEVEVREQE